MQFSPIIRVLMLAALCVASACTYIIPEDTNPPRYNKVIGDRKVPELNRQIGPQTQAQPIMAPVAMQNPAMAPLPAVDPQTRAIAAQEMAQQQQMVPQQQMAQSSAAVPQEEKGFWNSLAFWRDDEPEMANAAAPSPTTRRAPSGNGEYPVLSQVPANPANGSEVDRMAYVRSELERDRVNAALAKDQLAAESRAEPSLLSQMPYSAPSPDAVAVAPLPPPPPALPASTPTYVAPPVTYYPPAQTAMEPIVLRPPSAAPAPMPAYTPMSYSSAPKPVTSYKAPATATPPAASAMPVPMAGGFNPMAEPAPIQLHRPANSYANGNYLPDSRYTR